MKKYIIVMVLSMINASCQSTHPMPLPLMGDLNPLKITESRSKQATIVLAKVVADIKRGTTIAHFPNALPINGHLSKSFRKNGCNIANPSDRMVTLDWTGGRELIGKWDSDLGEVFYDVLQSKGVNVVGDPAELFGEEKHVASAEYVVGAKIIEIRGNICNAFDVWSGIPLNEYSGELYMKVEWNILSTLQNREVARFETAGYFFEQVPHRNGISHLLAEAFGNSVERLMGEDKFINVITRNIKPNNKESFAGDPIFVGIMRSSALKTRKSLDSAISTVVSLRIGAGHGSGFMISNDGYILTNAHVVGSAKKVGVILSNGVEVAGDVVRVNVGRDVALVKTTLRVPSALPIRFEQPKNLEVVYAIGSPIDESLRSTITKGIVSAFRHETLNGGPMIQSDAAISPGNSGGPLLDAEYNVIGISTEKIVRVGVEGLNFFIPIRSALEALNIQH